MENYYEFYLWQFFLPRLCHDMHVNTWPKKLLQIFGKYLAWINATKICDIVFFLKKNNILSIIFNLRHKPNLFMLWSMCYGILMLKKCRIHLKEILEEGIEKGRAEVQPTRYRVILADRTYRGDINVGLSFTAKVST